jgi:hypothetical protein
MGKGNTMAKRAVINRISDEEYLLKLGECPNQYWALCFTCRLYEQQRLEKYDFVRHVARLFSDDNGMDWADDEEKLLRFAMAIISG